MDSATMFHSVPALIIPPRGARRFASVATDGHETWVWTRGHPEVLDVLRAHRFWWSQPDGMWVRESYTYPPAELAAGTAQWISDTGCGVRVLDPAVADLVREGGWWADSSYAAYIVPYPHPADTDHVVILPRFGDTRCFTWAMDIPGAAYVPSIGVVVPVSSSDAICDFCGLFCEYACDGSYSLPECAI